MPLARLLYTQNPFYAISALLVLAAASSLFPAAESPFYAASLMIFLGVYTVVLTVICVAIVRRGQVWEDARSLVVIIGILLYALAMSFDELVFTHPLVGSILLTTTGIFAVGVVVGLFRGLGLALPRTILLAFLAGFLAVLAQPLLVGGALRLGLPHTSQAVLLGTPLLIAGIMLGVLPTLRRTGWEAFARECPWRGRAIAAGLGVVCVSGTIVREVVLCATVATSQGSPFSPTVLAPLCFAGGALLFVEGRARGSATVRRAGICLPALAFALSLFPAATPAAAEWHAALGRATLPAEEIVVLAALVFYAILAIVREREAWVGVILCSGAVAARLVEHGWTGSLGPRRTRSALALLFGGVSLAVGVWISSRKARTAVLGESGPSGESLPPIDREAL